MRDGILRVDFIPEVPEQRFWGRRWLAQQPKGAQLTVRWKGELRLVRVSRERGEQALGEVLVS